MTLKSTNVENVCKPGNRFHFESCCFSSYVIVTLCDVDSHILYKITSHNQTVNVRQTVTDTGDFFYTLDCLSVRYVEQSRYCFH